MSSSNALEEEKEAQTEEDEAEDGDQEVSSSNVLVKCPRLMF